MASRRLRGGTGISPGRGRGMVLAPGGGGFTSGGAGMCADWSDGERCSYRVFSMKMRPVSCMDLTSCRGMIKWPIRISCNLPAKQGEGESRYTQARQSSATETGSRLHGAGNENRGGYFTFTGGVTRMNATTSPITARTSTNGNTPIYDPVVVLINPASCGPAIAPTPYARNTTP